VADYGALALRILKKEGYPCRWRRFIEKDETDDGGVNLTPQRIDGLPDDATMILYGISEGKAQQLFGNDVRTDAVVVVTRGQGALIKEQDQVQVMAGTLAGQVYEVGRRAIDEAASLGGVVSIGLRSAGAGAPPGTWD
jgi:hypothetical protein